jgi:competence protein ComEA
MCAIVILGTALIPGVSPAWAYTPQQPAASQAPTPAKAAGAPRSGRAAKVLATAAAPVNLNSASAIQLQTLPGIGASTAQRILDYRQKNGAFKKTEELMNVKGIGEKSFLKMKSLVTVSEPKGDRAGAAK